MKGPREKNAHHAKELRKEIQQLRGQLEFQKREDERDRLETERIRLEIKEMKKPWWRREPVQALTLAFTILSTVAGWRPQTSGADARNDPPPIVEYSNRTRSDVYPNQPRDGAGGGAPEPKGLSGFRLFYLMHSREMEKQRWDALLANSPEDLRNAIDELLESAKAVHDDGADVEVIQQYVQSRLEQTYRTDPLWSSKARAVSESA